MCEELVAILQLFQNQMGFQRLRGIVIPMGSILLNVR